MRVLVTGATGGLGRNAVEYLLKQGIAVTGTGRNAAIGQALSDLGATFVAADLAHATSQVLSTLVAQADAVWHCAALSSPWGATRLFEDSNVHATANLLDAAGRAGVKRFVHISTPAIYFDFTHRYDIIESFRAESPANEYARTKALAEEKVRAVSLRYPGLRTVILRPRAIFGPYDQVLMPRLMHMLATKNGRLPLPRGGRTVLDMTYVDNVVHAMWLATANDHLPSGLTCNITNGEPAPIAFVLEKLFVRELKRRMRIVDVPYRALALGTEVLECISKLTRREPRLTRYSAGVLAFDMTLDLDCARATLGYVPAVALDEGISRTAFWLKKNG
jgi:nucleoside-diphosphate-sugar epimerase